MASSSTSRAGKSPDSQTRLNQAIAAADIPAILRLLDDQSLDLDRRDVGHDLQTPLMRLCHMRDAGGGGGGSLDRVVEKLERCAWNPNVQDSGGRTLVMHGCISRRPSVVLLCLENGCDVELTDRDGNSVLVYAVRNGGVDLVSLLLETEECQALVTTANNLGQTPLDVAHHDGLAAVATCLTSYMSPEQRLQQSTMATPFLTPRPAATPSSVLQTPGHIRRTASESSRGGLGLRLGLGLGHPDDSEAQGQGQGHGQGPREGEGGRRKKGGGGDLASLVSSRLAGGATTTHGALPPALGAAPTPASYRSRESTGLESSLLSSREVTHYSDTGDLSPRKARRRQRLLRRQTEGAEGEEVAEGRGESEEGGASPRREAPPRRGGGGGGGARKARPKQLHYRKDSVSLPDLRDFKGKLVASGEATPIGSDQSDVSCGRGAGPADEAASYVEVAACSLPQISKASSDPDSHRNDNADRARKLVHGTRKPNTDDVMLRSLIV